MDLDADSRINFSEFSEGIKPNEPYSKLLVRDRSTPRHVGLASATKKKMNKSVSFADDTIRTRALDRAFNMSASKKSSKSPLKYKANSMVL
jgi:hypothetical protein